MLKLEKTSIFNSFCERSRVLCIPNRGHSQLNMRRRSGRDSNIPVRSQRTTIVRLVFSLYIVYFNTPFVPRSQIEQQRTNAPMSGVENGDNQRQTEPVADNANVEEQINELNELLAHVLDEISSLKSAIYDKARTEKVRNPKKKIRGRNDDSDDTPTRWKRSRQDPRKLLLPTRSRHGRGTASTFPAAFSF